MTEKHYVKHRDTARVLLYTPESRFLLLKTHFDPEVGLPPRWLTPGGGIDAGETSRAAAKRELFEETGLEVSEDDLGDPVLEAEGRWDWSDGKSYHTYLDTIFELVTEEFEPDTSGFTSDEQRDVLEYKWWNISDLLKSKELVGPHSLREFLKIRFSNNR